MKRPSGRGSARGSGRTSGRASGRASPKKRASASPRRRPEFFELRLYIAGQTARSLAALANLKVICEEYLEGRYSLEVIDLLEHPQLAKDDQILALPTLVRKLPRPIRKLVGDLSHTEHALVGLDLRPKRPASR